MENKNTNKILNMKVKRIKTKQAILFRLYELQCKADLRDCPDTRAMEPFTFMWSERKLRLNNGFRSTSPSLIYKRNPSMCVLIELKGPYSLSQNETVCQRWHECIILNGRWYSWFNWRIYIETPFIAYWIASTQGLIEVFYIKDVIRCLDTAAFRVFCLYLWVCACICRKYLRAYFSAKRTFPVM